MKFPNTDPLEIPVSLDTPLYTERVTLEAVEYVFRFNWNDREGRWYVDVGDINETWIVVGVKLICNWPIFRRVMDLRMPPGVVMALDNSNLGGKPPGFYDLGRRVSLLYFPSS